MASIHPETPRSRGDPDAPHVTPVTPGEDMRTILINRVSWGAVFAGVAIALVTQLILNLIGIAVGAATFDPASSTNPSATTFSVGAGIWWTISGIIAALAGGYAAGRLAGQPKEASGAWHGLTAWAVATLVIFALLTTTLGAIAGGALRFAGSMAGDVAQTLGIAAQTATQAAAPALTQAADPLASLE
ncbi:MAG: PhnA-like protein, partial [Hyphomicrobiaceae bacterium]